jgi:hypothetical protein
MHTPVKISVCCKVGVRMLCFTCPVNPSTLRCKVGHTQQPFPLTCTGLLPYISCPLRPPPPRAPRQTHLSKLFAAGSICSTASSTGLTRFADALPVLPSCSPLLSQARCWCHHHTHLSKLLAVTSICSAASSPALNRMTDAPPAPPSGPTALAPVAHCPTAIQQPSGLTAAHTRLLPLPLFLLLAGELLPFPGVPEAPLASPAGGGVMSALTGRQP